MLAKTLPEMESQARELMAAIAGLRPDWKLDVSKEVSYLGGGSLPETEMPSFAVRIKASRIAADALALGFRTAETPVVPRVADNRVILDMRTVFPEDLPDILRAIDRMRSSGGRSE
jgi:L-seryl-tRNA(Ser) seleniumtransferase